MGTPDFAVPSLKALIEKGHEVAAVVTQPDKPSGRGQKVAFPAVKQAAMAMGLTVLQPEKVKVSSFISRLEEIKPEVIIVAAYGQMLPERILRLPKYGCINVHGSLLPKYRGASPVQSAVINGDSETGATIMRMDKGLDSGDIILQSRFPIGVDDTGGTVFDKMAEIGANTLVEAIELIKSGRAVYMPQYEAFVSYAPLLTKESGRIDFSKSACEIRNLIRGMNPWPAAYVYLNGEKVKIWGAKILEEKGTPGIVTGVISGEGFIAGCGYGSLLMTEVQAGSGKRMSAADYLRGHKIETGTRLE